MEHRGGRARPLLPDPSQRHFQHLHPMVLVGSENAHLGRAYDRLRFHGRARHLGTGGGRQFSRSDQDGGGVVSRQGTRAGNRAVQRRHQRGRDHLPDRRAVDVLHLGLAADLLRHWSLGNALGRGVVVALRHAGNAPASLRRRTRVHPARPVANRGAEDIGALAFAARLPGRVGVSDREHSRRPGLGHLYVLPARFSGQALPHPAGANRLVDGGVLFHRCIRRCGRRMAGG